MENFRIEEKTSEQIAQDYKSAMDSVNLINGSQPPEFDDEAWAECIARNKKHLQVMLEQDFWTTEDLIPLRNASA
jgi:fructose-1-phosphate kinase PfkB-like protein